MFRNRQPLRRTTIIFVGMGLISAVSIGPTAQSQQTDMSGMSDWIAQTLRERWPKPGSERLTVRPRMMATGATNPAAGTYPLDDSLFTNVAPPESSTTVQVTVPPQCAGTHRCPLLVQLPGGGLTAEHVTKWLAPVANDYGFLVLAPTTYTTRVIDVALRETLRRFAVDPAKIAIIGRCASGWAGLRFGIDNPDVFTRAGSISGDGPLFDGLNPHDTTLQFYIDDGLNELTDTMLTAVAATRKAGHPVTQLVTIRAHEDQTEDYMALGRWLRDGWATPTSSARPAPRRLSEPPPVLTTQALTQLTTFWTRFFQEPDTIRTTARRAYDRTIVVPLGKTQVLTVMVDMPALAAHVPAVAADLKAAGLTAEQHDAYRLAVVSALIASHTPAALAAAGDHSVLAQNVAFLQAHPDDVNALAWAGVSQQEELSDNGGVLGGWSQWQGNPEDVRAIGPMGIWRTP
jgi:hypothetical protein